MEKSLMGLSTSYRLDIAPNTKLAERILILMNKYQRIAQTWPNQLSHPSQWYGGNEAY